MAAVKNIHLVNVSDEDYDKACKLIDAHNATRTSENYYEIGLSGSKRAFYTLWVHIETGARYVSSMNGHLKGELIVIYRFIRNLSQDFLEAVEKVCERFKNSTYRIRLFDVDERVKYEYDRSLDAIPFGKYSGQYIEDVADSDFGYIKWFKGYLEEQKNKKPRYFGKRQAHLLERAETLIAEHYDAIREENRATSTSQYIGEIKDKLEDFDLVIDYVKPAGYFESAEVFGHIGENKVMFYGEGYEKGTCHIRRARVASHFEKLGVKYTRLNYIGR